MADILREGRTGDPSREVLIDSVIPFPKDGAFSVAWSDMVCSYRSLLLRVLTSDTSPAFLLSNVVSRPANVAGALRLHLLARGERERR